MADKVQLILEKLLEQSVPLLHKEVFTQDELSAQMRERQKHQYAMLRSTYTLPDFLKAIQYEYQLERMRRSRIQQFSSHGNSLFKKQGKTDFVILKRIIRLWDKTTHKFKFRLSLWKQYLQFCLVMGSKKHFYKALSNSLKMLPFESELWQIGIAYEKEVVCNFWKARKLYLKSLKLLPAGKSHLQMCYEMFKFEIEFLSKISIREKIIIDGEKQSMKFVKQLQFDKNKEISERFQNYEEIFEIIFEETIVKNCPIFQKPQKVIQTFMNIMKTTNVQNQRVELVLNKFQQKLIKNPYFREQSQQKNSISMKKPLFSAKNSLQIQLNKYLQQLHSFFLLKNHFQFQMLEQASKSFCLKPQYLSKLFVKLLQINPSQILQYLLNKYRKNRMPIRIIHHLLISQFKDKINSTTAKKLKMMLQFQVDRINTDLYIDNLTLLRAVILYNKFHGRYHQNQKLFRSVTVCYGNNSEVKLICKNMMASINDVITFQ